MITPATVLPGMDGVVGGAYQQATNQFFFVEFDGEIHRLTLATHADSTIGNGYSLLEDIALSRDGRHAYVTERGSTPGAGRLLKIDLLNANHMPRNVVAHGMTAPHQISLDEDRAQAYVVEFAPSGRLLRINLLTGALTVMATGLASAVGLVVTSDRLFAYVSEQTGGRITCIRLADGHRETVAHGLTQPFFLNFLDAGESLLLTTERDPANHVKVINLATSPATVTTIANVPNRPSQAVPGGPGEVLVCSDSVISKLGLLPYTAAGPILLGFGHVPINRISQAPLPPGVPAGFADTTVDPTYFFQVKDAPFGGSLATMINHQGAAAAGAHFYTIEVDGVPQTAPFTDYRLNPVTHNFDAISTSPTAGTFFPVRTAGDIWYNQWLGGFTNTTVFADGLRNVSVKLFSAANAASHIGLATDAGRHAQIMVDNGWPVAHIDQILHDGAIVPTCAIIHVGSTGVDAKFQFTITAEDPQKHLLSWNLSAMWGDNQSAGIVSQGYTPAVNKEWFGVAGSTLPALPGWNALIGGDMTSINCAHTFYLGVWDRVIDGWGYIHYSDYHKSITILP